MPGYEHLPPDAVKAKLDAGEPVRLIDVREPEEHAICRIAGAELLPLSQFHGWAPGLVAELQDADTPTVIYCHHGMRSQQACEILAGQGAAGLINMLGGIDGWADAVEPAMRRY